MKNKKQFTINISNKKILQGLLADLKVEEQKQYRVLKSIDKLDRIGPNGVGELLKEGRKDKSGAFTKGCELSNEQSLAILSFLNLKNIKDLKTNLKNPLSVEGVQELEELLEVISYGKNLAFDKTLFIVFFENPKSPFDMVFLYITYSKSPFDTVFLYITYSKSPFDTVLGSLPPPRGLCACLRRFGDLRKKARPWIFRTCILWIL